MTGDVLPPQIIYMGKTTRCHPNVKFPYQWNITHSKNHWSNTDTMVEYANAVLIPYVEILRVDNKKPKNAKCLLILDLFAAHRVDTFLNVLNEANIIPLFVPGNCTGELQPLDVAVNFIFKQKLKAKFIEYYADQVKAQLQEGKEIENVRVDLAASTIKNVQAKWLISVIDELQGEKEKIIMGFDKPGILSIVKNLLS
jgi:hypothetical protein